MKFRVSSICVLTLSALVSFATAQQKKDGGFQNATVVSIEQYTPPSNYVGDSPSDAPLQANGSSYDVRIRLNCDVYVGRYETATGYVPSIFAPNHPVNVRLAKHQMYVTLPTGDQVEMGIVSHKHGKQQACSTNG